VHNTIFSDNLGRVAAGDGQARPCGGACRDRNDDTLTGTRRGGVTSVRTREKFREGPQGSGRLYRPSDRQHGYQVKNHRTQEGAAGGL